MKYLTLAFFLIITSCDSVKFIPKFTSVEKTTQIKLGMSRTQVEELLGIKCYDNKGLDKEGNLTLIYKYRVVNRKLLPSERVDYINGLESWGKYGDIFITYSKEDKVTNTSTCADCLNLK